MNLTDIQLLAEAAKQQARKPKYDQAQDNVHKFMVTVLEEVLEKGGNRAPLAEASLELKDYINDALMLHDLMEDLKHTSEHALKFTENDSQRKIATLVLPMLALAKAMQEIDKIKLAERL